jgi:hypothetical protein
VQRAKKSFVTFVPGTFKIICLHHLKENLFEVKFSFLILVFFSKLHKIIILKNVIKYKHNVICSAAHNDTESAGKQAGWQPGREADNQTNW